MKISIHTQHLTVAPHNPFFASKDSALPLEMTFYIFDYLNLGEIAELASVSSTARFCVSAYFGYAAYREPEMRRELILQKQKAIKTTEQYMKSLETYRKFSLFESLATSSLFIAMFFYMAKEFPADYLTVFKLFSVLLTMTFITLTTLYYSKPSGYEFCEKIARLSSRHKQQYLLLPEDTKNKMNSKLKIGFSLTPNDPRFGNYLPIHRLVSMLAEIIGDLNAEIKALKEYPETFRLFDPKKSTSAQDPVVAKRIRSYLPIYPVEMMRDFQKFFIARQQQERAKDPTPDPIHTIMSAG